MSIEAKFVTPGTRIADKDEYQLGRGVYLRDDKIEGQTYIHVMQEHGETIVPEIGDTVTCKVIKVTPWYAKVKILCVEGRVLWNEVEGMIRVQDVRSTEIDKVKIEESFRPGDVVLATVLSLGDSRSYFLSTAKNELGVIYATSLTGSQMVPVSWKEMLCTKTKQKELRKVAKTF